MSETNGLGLPEDSLDVLKSLLEEQIKKRDRAQKAEKKKSEAQVKKVSCADGKQFIRVLNDYFEVVNGKLCRYLKGTLMDDFGKDFPASIPRYDGFIIEPSYFNYEAEVRKGKWVFWNLHKPLPYTPVEGEWKTIETLLKHVFEDQYEMALDWLQLLMTNPKQPLPIPCLVSSNQANGKTSVLNLISYLIPGNAVGISIDDFSSDFNAHFATKHVVLIDETESDATYNPKGISSKLKRWITQKQVVFNEKNVARSELDFYGKLVMCSNHEENFIKVEDEDTRFWIRRVQKIKGPKIDNFFQKLEAECKHFAYHLQHRTLETKENKGRFWFTDEQIRTSAFLNAAEWGKSNVYHDLKELILEDLNNVNADKYFYSSTELGELLLATKERYSAKWLAQVMKKDFKKEQEIRKVKGKSKRGWEFTRKELEGTEDLSPEGVDMDVFTLFN